MYTFNFPNMLGDVNSQLIEDKDAVRKNIVLTLNTEQLSLFGDPAYGSRLLTILFEQNTSLVIDLLIDEIYTTLVTFIPQIYIERKNITITTDKVNIYAELSYTYLVDGTSDMLSIRLTTYDNT